MRMLVEGKHNQLEANEKKKWQRGLKETVVEINGRSLNLFSEPNKETGGDEWMYSKVSMNAASAIVWHVKAKPVGCMFQ